jgi:Protein of unknown function (DUF3176)
MEIPADGIYLSIASKIANIASHFAFSEGVNVAWWRKALRGSTLAEPHRVYDYGHSLWPRILAGRHLNLVAVGCILVAASPVNGPLLQRASRVSATKPRRAAHVADTHSLGGTRQVHRVSIRPNREHSNAVKRVYADSTGGDNTKCHSDEGYWLQRSLPIFFLRGAGFAVNCTSHTPSPSIWLPYMATRLPSPMV